MNLSVQEPLSQQQLQLQQVCDTKLPDNGKLASLAKLYANAFAGPPWDEYKICQNGHYFGLSQSKLKNCTNCFQPLKLAYPEKETAEYIAKEVTKPEGTLITFEDDEGAILAAGWGYACTTEELQAKYTSPEMKEMVADKITKAAKKAQRVFYLSEIMVAPAARRQGIATKITKYLCETAQSLDLNPVMRTRYDSPMVQIANNMQMSQIISLGEDIDNPNRVLYIKI